MAITADFVDDEDLQSIQRGTRRAMRKRENQARKEGNKQEGDNVPVSLAAFKRQKAEEELSKNLEAWKVLKQSGKETQAQKAREELQLAVREGVKNLKAENDEKLPRQEQERQQALDAEKGRLEGLGHFIDVSRNHRGGWQLKCRDCRTHRPLTAAALWTTTCQAAEPRREKKDEEATASNVPSAVSSAAAPPTVGARPLHKSHGIWSYRGVLWCERCGAYATDRPMRLSAPCGGELATKAAQENIRRLHEEPPRMPKGKHFPKEMLEEEKPVQLWIAQGEGEQAQVEERQDEEFENQSSRKLTATAAMRAPN